MPDLWIFIVTGITLIAGIITINVFIRQRFLAGQLSADRHVATLARQAARWAIAAENDKNPIIALLHANYAAGYLWSLSAISSPEQFERAVGVDYHAFKDRITGVQDLATVELADRCPSIAPEPGMLAYVAGEGLLLSSGDANGDTQ